MGYLTAKQLSDKWGITERRIIKLCKENRINGARKDGMIWLIPENTIKPLDKRNKISKYINVQKRIMIVNINNEIGYNLISLLKKEGYITDGICNNDVKIHKEKLEDINIWKVEKYNKNEIDKVLENSDKYYEGLIIIDTETINKEEIQHKEYLIKEFSKKMNCESSIILVNNMENAKTKLEHKLSKKLADDVGLRINAININAPVKNERTINYYEIAEDVLELLKKFKNTSGISITTDGGHIEFDENGRTQKLEVGKFYKIINNYLKKLNKDSYMWCASIMLEDEWTEEPAEMNFRINNLDAANRGANIERIFIFSKSRIKEFKENKTLKIYMQSNINTMFVDYDEIKQKEPKLLELVKDGWDGIDKDTLIVDLPESDEKRGFISINKDEVKKAYECFINLKKYSKDLKEILK